VEIIDVLIVVIHLKIKNRLKLLNNHPNKMSEELKKEIRSIIASYNNENEATNREIIEEMNTFISSLLTKQQVDFVKCLPEKKETYEKADSIRELEGEDSLDKYGKLHERVGYNQCIADIKSKLK
jgi:hypothetical protein